MNRLYTPSQGVHTWRERLAEPTLHWKQGASAMELAIAWELAARTPRGLPESVARVLDAHPTTKGASLLFGFPEHQVTLPGGSRPSQTDLWAVLKSDSGLVSLAVEGKAREPFGPTIDEWLREPTAGKRVRLAALCETLGMESLESSELRYQLFHRAASAVLEASRIGARTAVLFVQSFYPASNAWADFQAFALLFGGATACRGSVCEVQCPAVDRLLLAWADSPVATNADVALVSANEVR
jgi:hypothetical protein